MLKLIDRGARSERPFSPAFIAGDFMYVSGQASVDREDGTIIRGTFEEEFRRSVENLRAILESAGLSLDHVINVKCYLGSGENGAEHNRLYREYFSDPLPTRSTISGVLGTSLHYELDGVAYVPMTRQEAAIG